MEGSQLNYPSIEKPLLPVDETPGCRLASMLQRMTQPHLFSFLVVFVRPHGETESFQQVQSTVNVL